MKVGHVTEGGASAGPNFLDQVRNIDKFRSFLLHNWSQFLQHVSVPCRTVPYLVTSSVADLFTSSGSDQKSHETKNKSNIINRYIRYFFEKLTF